MARLFNTGIDLRSQRATNAADPTAASDLATKNYADGKIDNTSVPLLGGVAAAGAASKAAPSNHIHPRYEWSAADHNLLGWSLDVAYASANSAVPTSGTLYLVRVHVPVAGSVTNLLLYITGAGAGLVSGENFAGLFSTSGSLIASTADQTSNFSAIGLRVCPLSGGPVALPAGDVYAGFFANGTTLPSLARGNNQSATLANVGLSSGNYRSATANTGLTTALPASAAAQNASAYLWWLGLS